MDDMLSTSDNSNAYIPGGCVPPLINKPTYPTFIPLAKPVQRTYIAFILDKSGSMNSVLDATILGFNKQIENITKEADPFGLNFYSLVTFNSEVAPVFFNRQNGFIERLSRDNYKPAGWTALYDAVGYTINRLDYSAEDVENSAFLITIISDGYENRSREWDSRRVSDLIRRKQATGKWTFTYLGSNQDLAAVSQTLSIPFGNVLNYNSTPEGVMYALNANFVSASTYLKNRERGITSSDSYFSESHTGTNI